VVVSYGWQSVRREREGERTAVHRVDSSESDEEAQIGLGVADAVETKPHGRQDGHGVLAAVDQVREHVPRVVVTPDALQRAPYRREGGEEAEQARVRRVALLRVVPAVRVETKEELDVLEAEMSVAVDRRSRVDQ
jgi:hypothetical protein